MSFHPVFMGVLGGLNSRLLKITLSRGQLATSSGFMLGAQAQSDQREGVDFPRGLQVLIGLKALQCLD